MLKNEEKNYWVQYYHSGSAPEEPSKFAEYVMNNYAKPGETLIELGCGNGRDARYFAANGMSVLGVDQVEAEIEELTLNNGQKDLLRYESADFTDMPDSNSPYDVIYSRFTLHSVTAKGQRSALEWSRRNLAAGGKLCIETRGQKNELYKKGDPVEGEKNAYIFNEHYRRFVDFEDFKEEISAVGFKIIEAAEKTGFAPFEDTDYHFIRVIAE